MAKFNIFRNPFIDAQVSMLMGSFDDAVRRQTEEYWRNEIAIQILDRCPERPVCDQCLLVSSFVRRGSARNERF